MNDMAEIKANADRLVELTNQQSVIKAEIDEIKAWFEKIATDDLKDTKKKTIDYWGSNNSKVVVGNSETVKPVSMTMVKKLLGDVFEEFVKEDTEQYFKGEQSSMKTIRVVAAVICDSIEHKTKIFSTARGYGEFKGGWEFPGGKIEAGETPQQAVVREIREELDATVRVGDLIDTIEYDYPAFHLSMDCFWCEVASGELKLLEAEAARWLTKEELDSVQWLPADVTLIDKIKSCMS